MSDHKYDVAVCWRTYPGVSKTPLFYKEDKYKLAELSFRSFLKSAEGLRVKYFIILDGCPARFDTIFTESVAEEDREIIRTDKIGNLGTFNKQLEILSAQTDAQLIYFAEDDYLYRPFVFRQMLIFFRDHPKVDFITPYDHLDHYEHPIHAKKGEEEIMNGIKWKSGISTCLTFLTSKKILRETLPVFNTYGRGNTDSSLWVTLTRIHRIRSMGKFLITDKECFFILKKAMKYSFWRFFAGKKYYLWHPVPAFATHLESKHIAPGVDWNAVKNLY